MCGRLPELCLLYACPYGSRSRGLCHLRGLLAQACKLTTYANLANTDLPEHVRRLHAKLRLGKPILPLECLVREPCLLSKLRVLLRRAHLRLLVRKRRLQRGLLVHARRLQAIGFALHSRLLFGIEVSKRGL